ncbi:MAG: hypothetical protein MJ002_03950 [Paludibacteraceae bacterium]|nr:hypothetical protein [Paludibacteraceae bacterium]
MKRNILLIEPNYKNKFPPVALMKLSTYHKRMGDNVVFYKGDIKDFIIYRIADKCINKLKTVDSSVYWASKKDIIFNFIKTRKKEYLETVNTNPNYKYFLVIENWLLYYKDYFWKKQYLKEPEWDRIFVTTLFTFYFDTTVKTINEVKGLIKKDGLLMVGGVLATLQPDELEKATGIRPFVGLLNTPGYLDADNPDVVDELPLDYTILEEIGYKYDMSNAYYGYLTRGCIRHCPFCAVPTLEPKYEDYIPIKERIEKVNEICGEQKDLLLMDNNILASKSFDRIIQEIVDCGFQKGASFTEPDHLEIAIDNLRKGINDNAYTRKVQSLLVDFYKSVENDEMGKDVFNSLYNHHLFKLITSTKQELLKSYEEIEDIYKAKRLPKKSYRRFVDFNQGVDARLFTPHIAEQLGRIAISPLRIAFDNIEIEDIYVNALKMCVKNGITHFSNYLLYNFMDKPEDLYRRMEINVNLCDELNVNIYSFPMKYHPLLGEHSHDRDYIGKHWNIKYIRAVQAILNCTKGMIGRGTQYFYKAFGQDVQEYKTLLEMPDTFIIYRFFFEWLESKSYPISIKNWADSMNDLSLDERDELFDVLHNNSFTSYSGNHNHSVKVSAVLEYYRNFRDAVTDKNSDLYKLKAEFDTIDKKKLEKYKNTVTKINWL